MPTEPRSPVLNPVLRFTRDPKPKPITGGGKNADSIKSERLEKQRKKIVRDLVAMSELLNDQPKFAGHSVVHVTMFDDSLATSWRPDDLLSRERGVRFLAPTGAGYIVEFDRSALRAIASATATTGRITDLVDISRIKSVRFFDEQDAVREFSTEEIWHAAPKFKEGRAFLVWLMPLSEGAASEALLERLPAMRGRIVLPAPTIRDQLSLDLDAPRSSLSRNLRARAQMDSLDMVAREYRQTRHASVAVVVPSQAALIELVASGAVFRVEPVQPIETAAPGSGPEPNRPLPANLAVMPVVGVVDGGLTASSYKTAAEAWVATPFVADGKADHVHGNQVSSLVVQGADWNNGLELPLLHCRIGTVQAVPKKGSGLCVLPGSLINYLDSIMTAQPRTKVWNFSFNQPGEGSLTDVSYLGHQLAILARKHGVLPIISIGNKPGKHLQAPADCEAALTTGGRQHDKVGAPAGSCGVSLAGPGPCAMMKPEISNFSNVRVIGGVQTKGSSFSAALTSPLAAHTFANLREPTPDLVRALILNAAAEGAHNPATGYGTPNKALPWSTPAGAVTLQWSAALRPGAAFYWELPIPPAMLRSGKLKGFARLTAILNPHPLVSDFAGENYFGARLETAVQYMHNDHTKNLLGSIQVQPKTETQAREQDHKWCPIRHHARKFNVSVDGNTLNVYGRVFTRDLYLHPYDTAGEVPPLDVTYVLTLGTGDEKDDLFGEIRTALGAFVEVATLDVDVSVTL